MNYLKKLLLTTSICLVTSVLLSVNAQVSIDNLNGTNPSCGAADGSLNVVATNALAYSINNGTFQSSGNFSGLAAGSYFVQAIDSLGSSDTSTIVLVGQNTLTFTNILTNPICGGESTGSIDVSFTGGTPPFQYSIDGINFQLASLLDTLIGGTYLITVIDDNGCADTITEILTEPLPISFTTTITDADCPTDNGEIDITAIGGSGNYTYSIDGGNNFVVGNVFTGLSTGGYSIIVMDDNNCSLAINDVVSSSNGNGPNVNINGVNPLCNGDNDGSITIIDFGAAPPVTYSLNGGAAQSANTFTQLSPGNYSVLATDGNGCSSGGSITISEPDLLLTNTQFFDETCTGGDGEIHLPTVGGVPNYQFSIDAGSSFQSSPDYTGLSGGTYTCIVEDANGCFTNQIITLNTGGGATITNIATTNPSCPLTADGAIVISAVAQNGPVTYSIDGGTTFLTDTSFGGLIAGTYDVQVQDGNGCISNQSVTIASSSSLVASATVSPQNGLSPLSVNFTNNSLGATGYEWDFGDGSTTDTTTSPSHTYTGNGTYNAILTITDGVCTDQTIVVIDVNGEPGITIPNVFTPNGDDINDFWEVQTTGISTLEGIIYNRWGEKVYQWFGPNGGWDGYTYPSGLKVPEGTYFYVIKAVGDDGSAYDQSGSVTILR